MPAPATPAPAAAELLHDPLTGLLSRSATLDALARALSLADRLQHPVTVLFIEIDGFGRYAPDAPDTGRLELAVAQRLAAVSGTPNTTLFLQLELQDFASVGANPLGLLRRSIPGYGKTNELPTDRSLISNY